MEVPPGSTHDRETASRLVAAAICSFLLPPVGLVFDILELRKARSRGYAAVHVAALIILTLVAAWFTFLIVGLVFFSGTRVGVE